jgi:hypothetical protein
MGLVSLGPEISIFGDVLCSVLQFDARLGLDPSGRARRFGLVAVAVGGTKIAQWVECGPGRLSSGRGHAPGSRRTPSHPLPDPVHRAPSLGSLKRTEHPPGTP